MRPSGLAGWVLVLGLVLGLTGCAEDGAPGGPVPAEQEAATSLEVTLRYPRGSDGDVPLAAIDGELDLEEGVRVELPSGAAAGAVQLGHGPVEIGTQARVGTLITQSNVHLERRARVEGDVTTAQRVLRARDAVVTGTIRERATVTPVNEERIRASSASDRRRPVDVRHGSRALVPGSYGALSVRAHATLRLTAGDYAFTRATFESRSRLEIDDSAGVVRVFLDGPMTFRGEVVTPSGFHPGLLVVQLGRGTTLLESAFRGSVVAPRGEIILASNHRPHEGSFCAKKVKVKKHTRIIHRPHFRLRVVERFAVPTAPYGPFGVMGFDGAGGFLVAGPRTVLSVTNAGAVSPLMPEGSDRPFVVARTAGFFGTYTPTQFELRNLAGSIVFAADRDPAGYASIVPGQELVIVAENGPDPEIPVTTHVHFQDRTGVTQRFATPGLTQLRLTPDHVVYTTRTELVRVTHAGVETWRRPIPVGRFEVSDNGATLIGLLASAPNSIVHVDLATGNTLGTTVLGGTFWNQGIAPSGRFSAATTQDRVYLFDGGTVARNLALPVKWAVSLAVADQGYAAVGAQQADHASEVFLVGPAGTGLSRTTRPTETYAYYPALRFSPGSPRLIVSQSAGLTAFDVERVR